MVNNIVQWGQNVLNTAINWVSNTINSIVNWFAQLPGRIQTWLSNVISSIANWASNMANKAKEGAMNLVNNVINTVRELPGKMLDAGRNIVEGLWNGIKNATSWIVEKVKEFAKGILDGIKNALGIHSPSVLFRDEVGKNIALGIGEGFIKNVGKTIKQMQNELDVATSKLSGNLVSNIDVVDNVGSVDKEPQRNVQFVLNFNVQKMTDAEMDRTFNYINRKFGSKFT